MSTTPWMIGTDYAIDVTSGDIDFSHVATGADPMGENGYSSDRPAGGGASGGSAGSQEESGSSANSLPRSGSKTGGSSNIGLNPFGYSLPVPAIPDFLKKYWDMLLLAGAAAAVVLIAADRAAMPSATSPRRK